MARTPPRKPFPARLAAALLAVPLLAAAAAATPPKNVIVLIGDGMGPEQVKAAGMYAHGAAGTLALEQLTHTARMTTASANNPVTDSAAAATAIATGVKVNNSVISLAIPGDAAPLPTMLELFKSLGRATGLVTTTEITHATPAAFAAHETHRNNRARIGQDFLNDSRPNVLFGGADSGLSPAHFSTDPDYTLVTSRSELAALNLNQTTHAAGLFGTGQLPYEYDYAQGTDTGYDTLPHLAEMTTAALDILDNNPDGLFLMVEGGRIDHAGHMSNSDPTLKTGRNIFETLEFDNAVAAVNAWAQTHPDTLILATADHETGGLTVTETNPQAGVLPTVTWAHSNHTAVNVPLTASGPGAHQITGTLDNTDLFPIAMPTPGDANLDGIVDRLDLKLWQANLFTNATWKKGDFNLDGIVDGQDLKLWHTHFTPADPDPAAAATAHTPTIPEPSTAALTALAAAALLSPRPKRPRPPRSTP